MVWELVFKKVLLHWGRVVSVALFLVYSISGFISATFAGAIHKTEMSLIKDISEASASRLRKF